MDILIIHFTLLRLNCEIPALATNSAVSPIESEATIILIFHYFSPILYIMLLIT